MAGSCAFQHPQIYCCALAARQAWSSASVSMWHCKLADEQQGVLIDAIAQ